MHLELRADNKQIEPIVATVDDVREIFREGGIAFLSGAAGFRRAAFNVSAMATWQDPRLDDEQMGWTRETAAAAEPWSFSGGGYVNYMQADEPIERVRAAFGDEAFERLQALKRRYDPNNILRRNQNIPPS